MILKNYSSKAIFPDRTIRLTTIFALAMLVASIASAADLPREKILMDFGWRFHLGDAPDAGKQFDFPEVENLAKTRYHETQMETNLDPYLPGLIATNDISSDPPDNYGRDVSFVRPKFDDSKWRQLDLPHDWAVELPFDDTDNSKEAINHGFKPVGPHYPQNSIGWYRKEFDLPKSDKRKTLWLDFDGVYRDSLVWLNGHCLGRHPDGYSSFRYDISRFANCGGKNVLVVRADVTRYEGWFYEGAGIYRHMWLEKTAPIAIAPDGIFVWSKFENNDLNGVCDVQIQTQLQNPQTNSVVKCEIISPDGKSLGQTHHTVDANGDVKSEFDFLPQQYMPLSRGMNPGDVLRFHIPILWSPENPKLYKLITTVENDGKIVDQKETKFGIRTIALDAEKGFLLNGKPYEIKGTCNHQDHAGVGSAIPDALQYWRVAKLKEMGCNAIRTSHNEPTPELLEACDRLGLLVMDENRRMDTNEDVLEDLKNFILRDRNHPSVFIWSLGNEEPVLQGSTNGEQVAAVMQNLVHEFDPTRLCTVAMNGKWGLGFSKVIDVQGFNYGTKNIYAYHTNHLMQPEIGTETASTVTTRGIYSDDKNRGYLGAYGESHPGWGAKPWGWWPFFATNPFTGGGFIWTGFDYRGEPTPYKWPCISSHFGLMDTCGFPKDIYYYYQSWWQDKPVLHIAPHWNWPGKIGKEVLVRVFSNCKKVELFLNRKSLGKRTMQLNSYLDWNVVYEPGTLSAKGFDENGKLMMETKIETTGAPAAIRLSPDRTMINADGEDVSVVNVSIVDAKGRVVPVADNLLHFELKGPGKIIGVGNGDPSCHEPDKCEGNWQRSAFNGYAQVIVQTEKKSGTIQLMAIADGLKKITANIRTIEPQLSAEN